MSLLSPQLEAFIAVADNKTVHGAADDIYITQTAVTQRIRALESKLRTSLFIRTRRGMLLTPEGEALLRYCSIVRELEGQTLAHIKGAAIETNIRLGITGPSSIMRSRIIPTCLPILKLFSHLLLTFNINDIENRDKTLKSGDFQLAILQPENVSQEMEYKILAPEHYILVCTNKWKERKIKDILTSERIIDFDPTDQMSFAYLKKYKLLKFAQTERLFVNNTEALATMLINGNGYGVLAKEFCESYLLKNQLMVLNSGKTFENKHALAWYSRPELPSYFMALINAIN